MKNRKNNKTSIKKNQIINQKKRQKNKKQKTLKAQNNIFENSQ